MRMRSLAGAVLAAVLLFFTVLPSFGGPVLPRRMGGLALGGLFPMGAFNDRVPQNGLGVGFFYAWRVRNAPVFAGLELSLHAYGRVSRSTALVDYPDLWVDVETLNNIMQGLAVIRIQPRTGAAVTYIEVLAGVSYLFTETTISGGYDYDDDLYSETNFDDVTVTAGAGAGVSVRLGRRRVRLGGTFLDFKVRYMLGGRAEYLKQGSIVPGDGGFDFLPERSATSFVTAQLGLSFFF